MRNLRERLMAVTSSSAAVKAPAQPKTEAFFMREHVVPLDLLCGIEDSTLKEIQACDPMFCGTEWDIRKVLFLDTETTGLNGGAGTVAFEIGIGFIDARGMVIRQYVMRDYSEEAAMLQEIARLFHRFDVVVSFNGKSFDLPLLESRMIMCRIRQSITKMPHFDLLHAARRVYKLRLKRCNLAALEEAVLDQRREDDLPGAQIPQRYFDYIRTREFAILEDVLRHNFEDVKSLAMLTGHLCSVFRVPQQLAHPEDIFSVGKTLMRTGNSEKARTCFKIVGHTSLAAQAHMHLAISYKKEKDWQEAVDSWQSMIACGEGGVWPYIELAKYYEHAVGDIPLALSYAGGALQYTLNVMPVKGFDAVQDKQIRKRIERLRRKQNRM